MIRHEVLRGGVSVDWAVVQALIRIEDRGGHFEVTNGAIRVLPQGVLSAEERAFLVTRKPEVLKILNYRADDHLPVDSARTAE